MLAADKLPVVGLVGWAVVHWGEVEGHLRHPPTPPSGPEHELPLKKKMLTAAFTINETTMLIIIKSTRATITLGFTRRSLVQRAHQQIVG